MKTYCIIEHVNPYHAHLKHNGEEVVKYDGATPVEWVVGDMTYPTEDKAKEALFDLACLFEEKNDDLHYEDDDTVAELKRQLEEDGITPDIDEWYKGEGIYYQGSNQPMMLKKDTSFDYDIEIFRIAER